MIKRRARPPRPRPLRMRAGVPVEGREAGQLLARRSRWAKLFSGQRYEYDFMFSSGLLRQIGAVPPSPLGRSERTAASRDHSRPASTRALGRLSEKRGSGGLTSPRSSPGATIERSARPDAPSPSSAMPSYSGLAFYTVRANMGSKHADDRENARGGAVLHRFAFSPRALRPGGRISRVSNGAYLPSGRARREKATPLGPGRLARSLSS